MRREEKNRKGVSMKRAITFMACLLFIAPAVQADWTGAVADRNISLDTGPYDLAQYVRIASGPEGNLYCVWRKGSTMTEYELYFGRSTDQGVTWSSETAEFMISANDGQDVSSVGRKCLGIATDSQGNIFIVWAEDLISVQEIMLLKSTDEGVTWIHSDTDFNISYDGAPANDAFDPDIAIDHNDNIFVVWHQRPASDTSEIHISISTDAGNTWSGTSGDRYISYESGQIASNPSIAISPNNDIYVVWDEPATQGNSATYRILYGKSTDGGATFNSEAADQPISTEIRFSGDAIVVVDDSNRVHVTWEASLDSVSTFIYDIFYSGSTDGGATWSGLAGPQFVDYGPDDGSSAHNHGMGITSGGCLVVVWDEEPITYVQNEVWASYSFDGGVTWTGNDEPERISFPDVPDPRGAYRPDIVAGAGDTLHAVWSESAEPSGGNYYDIHYSKGDTLTFCGGGGGGGCDYVVGDVNGSDSYNGLDVTYGVNWFKYNVDPPLCPDCPVGDCNTWYYCGDVNGSCSYNGLDITYNVNWFKYGIDPAVPCPDCPPN
jgi:hypothetical protein